MDKEVVAETSSIIVANAWKEMLDEEGIEAEVAGSALESLGAGLATRSEYAVIVNASDLERARVLIAEIEAQAAAEAGDNADAAEEAEEATE